MSEPLGVSHGRIGGGADAPSGRKGQRASWEIRLGVMSRGRLVDEVGGVEGDESGASSEEGRLGIAGEGLDTGDDGESVTEVGDGGLDTNRIS